MSAPQQLWLVRHARPLVGEGVCYGMSDVAADPADTQLAAERLAAVLPCGAVLLMSGLQRAQQLARALHALRPDLAAPGVDTRLNEMDFGCWEGRRWDEIDRAAFDAWTQDFAGHRFGGRESVGDVLARVASALREAGPGLPVLDAAPGGQRDRVWVTHAGVIRAVHYLQSSPDTLPQASQWPRHAPAFGQWTTLELPHPV